MEVKSDEKIGYRALAITAVLLLPFGTQPNLVCVASGEGIEYDDEQDDASIIAMNVNGLMAVLSAQILISVFSGYKQCIVLKKICKISLMKI